MAILNAIVGPYKTFWAVCLFTLPGFFVGYTYSQTANLSEICTVDCNFENGTILPTGNYADCNRCFGYIGCNFGYVNNLTCPFGTNYYDRKSGVCVTDISVCRNDTVPTPRPISAAPPDQTSSSVTTTAPTTATAETPSIATAPTNSTLNSTTTTTTTSSSASSSHQPDSTTAVTTEPTTSAPISPSSSSTAEISTAPSTITSTTTTSTATATQSSSSPTSATTASTAATTQSSSTTQVLTEKTTGIGTGVYATCTNSCKFGNGSNLPSGNYADCTRCNGYIACNDGYVYVMNCSTGTTFYDRWIGVCVINNSVCRNDTPPVVTVQTTTTPSTTTGTNSGGIYIPRPGAESQTYWFSVDFHNKYGNNNMRAGIVDLGRASSELVRQSSSVARDTESGEVWYRYNNAQFANTKCLNTAANLGADYVKCPINSTNVDKICDFKVLHTPTKPVSSSMDMVFYMCYQK